MVVLNQTFARLPKFERQGNISSNHCQKQDAAYFNREDCRRMFFSWNYLKIYLSIILSKGYKYIWAILGSTFWSKSKKEKLPHGWFSFTLSLSSTSTFTFLTIFFSLKKKKIPCRKISAWLASCSSCHFLTWSWFLFSRLHLLPDIFDSHHFDFSFWENGICPETPTEVDVGKKFRCVVCTISYFVCWWERQNFLVKITFCCLFSSSLALKATYIASSPTRLIFKAQYKISSIHNFFANRKKWNDKYIWQGERNIFGK